MICQCSTASLYGLSHAKMCLRVYADSEGPDQTARSDQGLRCPLPESLHTTECINGEQRLG